MTAVTSSQVFTRIAWGIAFICLVTFLFWLDASRSGNQPWTKHCTLLASKAPNAHNDILIFGSSRSGTAFDHYYLNTLFAKEPSLKNITAQRMTLTGPDAVSSYFLLKNRIENGLAPKLIVLELMRDTKKKSNKSKQYRIRRAAMLRTSQQLEITEKFPEKNKDFISTDKITLLVDRYTSIIYGFLKHPEPGFWSISSCDSPKDWSKGKAWATAERVAKGDIDTELKKSRAYLKKTYAKALQKMKMKKGFIYYPKPDPEYSIFHDIKTPYRRKEIRELQAVVALANKNDIHVVLSVVLNYGERLQTVDKELLAKKFPTAEIFDMEGNSGELLNAHWRDPRHVDKDASWLTSALLARTIAKELAND